MGSDIGMDDDFDGREARTSALDKFAGLTGGNAGESRDMVIPAQAFDDLGNRALGAQPVAVHRDEAIVLQKLKVLGGAAGEAWYWRWPVKTKEKGPDGKDTGRYVQEWIEGPSIKLANDLARIYGNCDVDVRVRDLGDSWLFYARFTDFETGFSITRPFQQRKSQMDKVMKSDLDRARDMAMQVGVSKAIRNVVVNALQTFTDFAFEAAKESIVERIGKKLDYYRTKVLERLAEEKVDVRRVERVLGRANTQWLAPDVARVIATAKAVSDGMATWPESYPPLDAEPEVQKEAAKDPPPATAEESLDSFAGGGAKTTNGEKAAAGASTPAAAKGEAASSGAPAVTASPAAEVKVAAAATPAAATATGATSEARSTSPERTAGAGEVRADAAPAAGPAAAAAGPAKAADEGTATTAASPAAPRLTKENGATLLGYSKALMLGESSNGLQRKGMEYFDGDMPDESTPLGQAVAQVFEWHSERVKNKRTSSNVDNAVTDLIARGTAARQGTGK